MPQPALVGAPPSATPPSPGPTDVASGAELPLALASATATRLPLVDAPLEAPLMPVAPEPIDPLEAPLEAVDPVEAPLIGLDPLETFSAGATVGPELAEHACTKAAASTKQ
jgi:hypothetical protein